MLDGETARLAILAGASYIVSPAFRPDVIAVCKRYGVAVMPGAMTPTEVLNAWEAVADVVKKTSRCWRATISQRLEGPVPVYRDYAYGCGEPQNYSHSSSRLRGAFAIGLGGELASKPLIAARKFATITQNARILWRS